jgi:3-isopropylmalate/(R)-2-methylmalate dehydratase small subunit
MGFEPIHIINSRVVVLEVDNIDTDRIIPARFLKAVDTAGFGKNLFYDWRYLPDGTPNPEFVLNTPQGRGKILLTGKNFGCGSSREHAAWALYQYGFRAIISSGFADIFRTNALNNGLLPIEVPDSTLKELFECYQSDSEIEWTVNLAEQTLVPPCPHAPVPFKITAFRKQCLLQGLDLIDYLASLKPEIARYEQNRVKAL